MTSLTDVTQIYLASAYADQAIKPPVRLAATVNITPIGIGQTIDGAVTQLGDRILLTAQTDARQNGERVVSDGIWPVPGDFSNLVSGTLFTVTAGVANAGQWTLTTANPITLGVTSLTFQTSVVGGLAAETAARIAADNTLQGNINSEASTRATNDTAEVNARIAAVSAEASTRATNDTTLQTNITAEATTRATNDTTIVNNLSASSGSSLVGFLQSGTGAVTRTVQSKNRDIVSVFDFFTSAQIADVQANTSLQDVGTAISTALAVVAVLNAGFPSGKSLYFPAGTYMYATSPNFSIVNGLNLIGEPGTVFNHTGSGNAFNVDSGAGFINELVFSNFRIQGNSNSTNGLYLRGIGRSQFYNIWSTGCAPTGSALRVDFGLVNTWINFQVNSTGGSSIPLNGILLTKNVAGAHTTTQTFINPIIEGLATATGSGVLIDFADSNAFIGGTIESNINGVTMTANGGGFNWLGGGIDIESNTTKDLSIACPKNMFVGTETTGTGATLFTGASCVGNTWIGGRLGALTLDGTSLQNTFINVPIVTSLTDTALLSSFINCTVAGSPITSKIPGTLSVSQVTTPAATNLTLNPTGGAINPNADLGQQLGTAALRYLQIFAQTVDANGTLNLNTASGSDIKWGKANVALGGGAAPTVGTIGGSGPAAAGQRNWLRIIESDGTASFIPVWR